MPSFAPDPNQELIAAQFLETGRLIENAARELASGWAADATDHYEWIMLLTDLADAVTTLSEAAMTLHRLREPSDTRSSGTLSR